MEELFCYGTLLDPEVQQKLIGRTVVGVEDVLPNYSTKDEIIHGDAYFRAIPEEGKELKGTRLSVSLEELQKMDTHEAPEYKRIKILLNSGVQAWMYV